MAEAHAPGKLVICGEYAVLHGAPAIAVAVDVRARAAVAPGAGVSRLTLPGAGAWEFDWQQGAPRWRVAPPAGQGLVLEAVAEALTARGMTPAAALDVVLDSRAFSTEHGGRGTEKLGLGSSAAIAVALTAALLAGMGRGATDRRALLEICTDAHRRFQRGSGSGVDVAAAVHGGVIALEPAAPVPRVRELAWPRGLHWLAAWSGAGASTTALLGRCETFRVADRARFERHMGQLRDIAATALAAWIRDDAGAVLQALADYDDALRAFDDGAGIGIYTPAHRRLAEAAGAAGAVYKISGAGGGDFGIALADSAEVIARLRATLADADVLTLAGSAAVPGLAAG